MAYRDKWPWEERQAKLMQIPLKGSDRNSWLGRQLYGKAKGTAYVNFAFFNPLLSRGANTLGVSGAFEARQLGGSADQMAEAAVRWSANSLLHPLASGPLFRAGMIGATGYEPYLTDASPPALMQATRRRHMPSKRPFSFAEQTGMNVAEGALSVNNFLQNVASKVGLGYKGDQEAEKGNRYLRMMTDLVLPRLAGAVTDQNAKAKRLQNERRKRQ
jgi:hypothetical protein